MAILLSRVPFLFAGTKPKNQTITIARQRGWDGISSVASPSLVYGHALGTGPLLGHAIGTSPLSGQAHFWDRPILGTDPLVIIDGG